MTPLVFRSIGYAGYKTYRETQPAIVNAETVSTAIAVLSKQLESKGLREQEYQNQIKRSVRRPGWSRSRHGSMP